VLSSSSASAASGGSTVRSSWLATGSSHWILQPLRGRRMTATTKPYALRESSPKATTRGSKSGRGQSAGGTRASGRSASSDCAAALGTSASACSSRSWLYGPSQNSREMGSMLLSAARLLGCSAARLLGMQEPRRRGAEVPRCRDAEVSLMPPGRGLSFRRCGTACRAPGGARRLRRRGSCSSRR
jgi:hypothetical protein